MGKLYDRVQSDIAIQLPPRLEIVIDAWSHDHSYYVAIFANYSYNWINET